MTIRDKAQGWIAWTIVILISVPFALWGIQEYLGVGSEPVVVKINDREVTEKEVDRAAFRLRNELREKLGAQYKAELFEESLLRKQVLEGIIRDTLIQQAASDLGLSASNLMLQQTIMNIPAFQVAGQFNQASYKRAVQLQGLTEKGFEERLRNSLVTRQLEMAIKNSSIVTKSFAKEFDRLNKQTRHVSYFTLSTANHSIGSDLSDTEIKAYYDNNTSQFMTEERVKVDYVLLNNEVISASLTVNDDDLRTYYQQNKSAFVAPDKKRLSHILFEVADDASPDQVEAIKTKAQTVLEALKQGKSFKELAQENSDDVASAELGGDLGFLETGIFDKAFEEAALSLDVDQISSLVRTRFGLHIIKVTEVIKGGKDDFEAVKPMVKKAYLSNEADQIFYDYAERLGNLAYETPDSLEPVSADLGLPIMHTAWITRDSTQDIFASPKVSGAVFSDEVLSQGFNSEVIELSPTQLVVLRVVEHEEASIKPLAEVKSMIEDHLRASKLFSGLQKKVEESLKLLRDSNSAVTFTTLAEKEGVEVSSAVDIQRDSSDLPFAVVQESFKLPKPSEDNKEYASAIINKQEIALIMVDGVQDGVTDDAVATMANLLAEQGNDEFELYVENLRLKADIQYMSQ